MTIRSVSLVSVSFAPLPMAGRGSSQNVTPANAFGSHYVLNSNGGRLIVQDQVFEQQSDSGIWHKYFPLFHFPGSGAADYCFSFEFLEAILIEFSEFEILSKTGILEGIEKAVKWCGNNRFKVREGTEVYNGWNA